MEPGLIVGAAALRGAAWLIGARVEGSVMAESRWPVVMTARATVLGCIGVAAGADRLYVRWHGRPVRRYSDVRRRLSVLFCRAW
jgi:hypothetical protein